MVACFVRLPAMTSAQGRALHDGSRLPATTDRLVVVLDGRAEPLHLVQHVQIPDLPQLVELLGRAGLGRRSRSQW